MSFRGRLLLAVTGLTVAALGGALGGVWVAFNADQERQLDQALLAVARADASEVERSGPTALGLLQGRPGPRANDVGPLPTHDVLYAPDGSVVASTPHDDAPPPPLASLPGDRGRCFDLWRGHEHMRAVVLPAGSSTLLVASPRTDIDGDARFLASAMGLSLVVAVAWAALVARWAIRRLTRDHLAIAAVARRVAGGDLSARVGAGRVDPEIAQLSSDIDAMIARLESFVTSQRRFVAHAAHELRTPLTALYGELQHAAARPRDESEYREAIGEALDATRRLKAVADDLLALASLGSRRASVQGPVDLSLLAHQTASLLGREADERGVRLEIEGSGPVVLGDELELGRMLRNLVENAVRYTGRGHRVTVTIGGRAGRAQIAIEDDGPGIRPDDRPHVFEPFFRGSVERSGPVQGTGLGLSIARETARAHGGEIALDEAHEHGARFVVTLPAATAPSDRPAERLYAPPMLRRPASALALAIGLAASALALPAAALDKQGSAHGGEVEGQEEGFDIEGSVTLGASLYNTTYAARPDNTGLALMRYAGHADVDLLGRKLSVPLDINLFTDRQRGGLRKLSPTELDMIGGLTTTWAAGPGALELGTRVEHDRPVDQGSFSQTYADARLRYLYSLAKIWPSLGDALARGDISGAATLGWFAVNPTYAARPDNTGLALMRYGLRAELSILDDLLSFGLDNTMFTDRQTSGARKLRPSELDLTPEVILHVAPFEFHLAYERDMPLDRSGLVQAFVYGLAVWNFDLLHPPTQPMQSRGQVLSP